MKNKFKITTIFIFGILFFASCSRSTIAEEGVAAPRICVVGTGDNAKLMLTKSPKNYGSIFQFGSVIAWSGAGKKAVVEFNPSRQGKSWNNNWEVGETYPAHVVGNLKEGKGDPCRLVGFSIAEIKAAIKDKAASSPAPDNNTWRMPTIDENKAIALSYSSLSILEGIHGRYFGEIIKETGEKEFMPAAGYRDGNDGELIDQGSSGDYWSGTPLYDNGYCLRFRSRVYPHTFTFQNYGFSVRCVRQ